MGISLENLYVGIGASQILALEFVQAADNH